MTDNLYILINKYNRIRIHEINFLKIFFDTKLTQNYCIVLYNKEVKRKWVI